MILNVCGGMPSEIANIVSKVITIIQIVVPVGLVIFGMLDFAKATWAQKDEEIAKGRNTFFKRLINGALVFFVIAIVRLVFSLIDTNGSGETISCLNAILNGSGGSSYEGGTSNKTTTTQPCNYYGYDNCKASPNCEWYGPNTGEGYCGKPGGQYTTEYQKACKFAEDLYGTKSNKYTDCINCYRLSGYTGDELEACTKKGYKVYAGIQNNNNNCSKTKNQKIEAAMNKCKSVIASEYFFTYGSNNIFESYMLGFNDEFDLELSRHSLCNDILTEKFIVKKGQVLVEVYDVFEAAKTDYKNAIDEYDKCIK